MDHRGKKNPKQSSGLQSYASYNVHELQTGAQPKGFAMCDICIYNTMHTNTFIIHL